MRHLAGSRASGEQSFWKQMVKKYHAPDDAGVLVIFAMSSAKCCIISVVTGPTMRLLISVLSIVMIGRMPFVLLVINTS